MPHNSPMIIISLRVVKVLWNVSIKVLSFFCMIRFSM